MPMQLALETSKAINGMLINYEAHAMQMAELQTRLVESETERAHSERIRDLYYEEHRKMNSTIRDLQCANLNLRQSYANMREDLYNGITDESAEADSTIQRLTQAVKKLEQEKAIDAALYKITVNSINILHNRISKLEHRCSGYKGANTKKKKLILQLRQVSGVDLV